MLQPTKEPDVNELDTSGEPTAVAKERDETNETIVVPDAGPTQAVELAWSSEDETEDYDAPTERHTWGATWSTAGVFILCAAVLAGVIGVVGWALVQGRDTRVPTPQSTSVPAEPPSTAAAPVQSTTLPPAAAPAPPPPTTVTVTETPTPVALPPAPVTVAPRRPDPDQTFIGLASQIPGMTIADPTIAEAGGRKVCAYLQAGHSRADTNATVLQNDPTFTPWQANAVVNAAITAYCPQYATALEFLRRNSPRPSLPWPCPNSQPLGVSCG
jgi:hypothetical protein